MFECLEKTRETGKTSSAARRYLPRCPRKSARHTLPAITSTSLPGCRSLDGLPETPGSLDNPGMVPRNRENNCNSSPKSIDKRRRCPYNNAHGRTTDTADTSDSRRAPRDDHTRVEALTA